MVDDDLLGWGGLASWGAPKQLGCLLVQLRRPWGALYLQQVVLDDGLVEGVGGVAVFGPWLLLDHRPLHGLGDVDGRLVEDHGAILLMEVLGGRGRGQADHLIVVVVFFGLDPDLLVQLSITDVFVAVLIFLVLLAAGGAEA